MPTSVTEFAMDSATWKNTTATHVAGVFEAITSWDDHLIDAAQLGRCRRGNRIS